MVFQSSVRFFSFSTAGLQTHPPPIMCSKVTVVCFLAVVVAAVQAGYVGHEYAHQNYAFKYGVSDHHTGDIKSQDEHGDGGNVHGSYSLVQPDGVTRVVSYHADPHNGFNADVKYIGHAHHPQTYGHGAAYPGHGY